MNSFSFFSAIAVCTSLLCSPAFAKSAPPDTMASVIEQLQTFNKKEAMWSKGILIDERILPFSGNRQELLDRHIKQHGPVAGGDGECCSCHW
ncbi:MULTISPECIES: hypothetical protein [unclassified Roseibium]|uniref:hypothetical protein n=1 Tax=unclassified Roseibium TaxID=2629323 RepID=UPI0031746EFA